MPAQIREGCYKPSSTDCLVQDKVIKYMYDFSDSWSHKMTVAGHVPVTDNVTCVDGTGHGAGEDVTRDGWRELKTTYIGQSISAPNSGEDAMV